MEFSCDQFTFLGEWRFQLAFFSLGFVNYFGDKPQKCLVAVVGTKKKVLTHGKNRKWESLFTGSQVLCCSKVSWQLYNQTSPLA